MPVSVGQLKRYSPGDLRKMPKSKRDAILRAQAEYIEDEYRSNPRLTDTECLMEEDWHGESSNDRTG